MAHGDVGRGGTLTVYDKTQGVQNVQRYPCSVLEKKSDDIRLHVRSSAALWLRLRPQYQVVLAALGAMRSSGRFGWC